jgi:hypothetical protein
MKQPKHQALISTETNFSETEKADISLLTASLSVLCERNEKPMNLIERNALFGMISYVAYTQKVGEAVISEILTSHYGVSTVAALPSRLYQNAIEHLLDLKTDKVIN